MDATYPVPCKPSLLLVLVLLSSLSLLLLSPLLLRAEPTTPCMVQPLARLTLVHMAPNLCSAHETRKSAGTYRGMLCQTASQPGAAARERATGGARWACKQDMSAQSSSWHQDQVWHRKRFCLLQCPWRRQREQGVQGTVFANAACVRRRKTTHRAPGAPRRTTVTWSTTTQCEQRGTRPEMHGTAPAPDVGRLLSSARRLPVEQTGTIVARERTQPCKTNAPRGPVRVGKTGRQTAAGKTAGRKGKRGRSRACTAGSRAGRKEWQDEVELILAHEDEALVRSLVGVVAPNCFENASHE